MNKLRLDFKKKEDKLFKLHLWNNWMFQKMKFNVMNPNPMKTS